MAPSFTRSERSNAGPVCGVDDQGGALARDGGLGRTCVPRGKTQRWSPLECGHSVKLPAQTRSRGDATHRPTVYSPMSSRARGSCIVRSDNAAILKHAQTTSVHAAAAAPINPPIAHSHQLRSGIYFRPFRSCLSATAQRAHSTTPTTARSTPIAINTQSLIYSPLRRFQMTHVATEQIVPSTRNRRKRFQFIAIPFVRDDENLQSARLHGPVTVGECPDGQQRRAECRRNSRHFRPQNSFGRIRRTTHGPLRHKHEPLRSQIGRSRCELPSR